MERFASSKTTGTFPETYAQNTVMAVEVKALYAPCTSLKQEILQFSGKIRMMQVQ
jgi:hypothetical protein